MVGPGAGLDVLVKKKKSLISNGIRNPDLPASMCQELNHKTAVAVHVLKDAVI